MSLIRTSRLGKSYRRGSEIVHALHGVDLELSRGEFTCIVGPSGSGKSTLLNLLGCLDRPTEGSYRLDGQETAGLRERDLVKLRRQYIGFVFQQFHLLPTLTVQENVELPRLFSRRGPDRTDELLAVVGLEHRRQHLPRQLSGGEMQRAAIARALVNRPPVLLADEPTGNLDTRNGNQVIRLLRELGADGLTVIVVTHNPALAGQADRVLALCDGRIEEAS